VETHGLAEFQLPKGKGAWGESQGFKAFVSVVTEILLETLP
jgi:hypothetical protein